MTENSEQRTSGFDVEKPEELKAAEAGVNLVDALTPDLKKVESAAELIAHLFDVMGIKRVVSVDDLYEGTLAQLLTFVSRIADVNADEFHGVSLHDPEEIWEAELTAAWNEASVSEQRAMLSSARKQSGVADQEEEQPDISFLPPLLPPADQVDFLALTPAEWEERRGALLTEADNLPTLVLLDRQMGEQTDAGIRLAEEIFDADADGSVYVGLLTRTVQAGDEHEQWKALTAANARLKAERFVVMSKYNLGPDPEAFAQPLKLVLMALPADRMRAEMRTAITAGVEHAFSVMHELSPQEFEKMIFGVSMKEGVWEPESLLRVFQVLMRREVRRLMYESDGMRGDASHIRQLCAVTPPGPPSTPDAIAVASAERYDAGEHLNPIHLPVEMGDIFETSSGSQWVLVQQPCDFAIRSDGVRNPEVFDVAMFPVKGTEPTSREAGYKLDFYYEDGRPAWVHMNRPVFVPVEALDLVVANRDGRSVLAAKFSAPQGLWPAWSARVERLVERLRGSQALLSELDRLVGDKGLEKEMRKRIADHLFAGHKKSGRKITVTVNRNGEVRYDLRRVRRVLPPYSRALLLQVSRFNARDAFDPDLASTAVPEEKEEISA